MRNSIIELDIRFIGFCHKLKKLKEFWVLYKKSCTHIDNEINKILKEVK